MNELLSREVEGIGPMTPQQPSIFIEKVLTPTSFLT
jgi:hypothetical protein